MIGKRERQFADKMKEKPPDFGDTEGNHDREIRRYVSLSSVGCFWLWGLERLLRLFLSTFSSPLARKTAKKARANIESVT
ncbi:hypothetical protein KSC_030960 [Ktedonobacter sp. SOSP1-52]|nr:hypothetical protein KSC_030960 [Ktedonobacter sp. SOSP1-52]